MGFGQLHGLIKALPAIILPNWIALLVTHMTVRGNEDTYSICVCDELVRCYKLGPKADQPENAGMMDVPPLKSC